MNNRRIFYALVLIAILALPHASNARWMNPQTGRFWTMDSYEGNPEDTPSLHKYVYAHADPVNLTDASGFAVEYDAGKGGKVHSLFSIWCTRQGLLSTPNGTLHQYLPTLFPKGSAGATLKPDCIDAQQQVYYELKPVTHSRSATLQIQDNTQMTSYDQALQPRSFFRGDQHEFVDDKQLLGLIEHQGKHYAVFMYPSEDEMRPTRLNGRGFIYYSLLQINGRRNVFRSIVEDIGPHLWLVPLAASRMSTTTTAGLTAVHAARALALPTGAAAAAGLETRAALQVQISSMSGQ